MNEITGTYTLTDGHGIEWVYMDDTSDQTTTLVDVKYPQSMNTTQTQFSSVWNNNVPSAPAIQCLLCGEFSKDALCAGCREIFLEFKEFFLKRKFEELMDELKE